MNVADMVMSPQGRHLLTEREGRKSVVYLDSKGYPTVGVGHMDEALQVGDVWTDEQIDAALAKDLDRFERSIRACVKVPLEQYQYDALGSFAFNLGEDALPHGGANRSPSSILRALNAGDYDAAGHAFNNWMADPEVRTRRAGERDQFRGIAFEARRPV